MKLIFAIVQDEDANKVMSTLNKNGFMVTKLSSTGGFLKSGNTTLLVGVNEQDINAVLSIIESKSKSRTAKMNTSNALSEGTDLMPIRTEITVGGATVFIINAEDYRKF